MKYNFIINVKKSEESKRIEFTLTKDNNGVVYLEGSAGDGKFKIITMINPYTGLIVNADGSTISLEDIFKK